MDMHAALVTFKSLPIDWLILLIVALIATVDCAWAGVNRSAALTLAFPLALFLYAAASQAAFLSLALDRASSPLMQAGVFGLVLLISWFAAYRLMPLFDAPASILLALITGLSVAICAIVYILATAPLQAVVHLSPSIHTVFGDAYRFWWLIASYIALVYVRM